MLLKSYDPLRFAKRYREYRRCMTVFVFLYLGAFAAGAVLWSRLSLSSFGEQLIAVTAQRAFSHGESSFLLGAFRAFSPRLITFLILFLGGITVYAPLLSGAAMLWWGLSGGVGLGFLFRFLSEGMLRWSIGADLLFSFLSALLLASYGAFVSCVALKQMGRIADGEDRIFGGTLFCGKFERKRINLRFFITYQLMFGLYAVCQLMLAFIYRFAMGFGAG